jgi:YVTN family beta-propeller protein
VEFRILGPLEASEQGAPIPLGAHKQRSLLALLLLHRGEVVSADRLIDDLWGEQPPRTATKSLQVYVSQLRKTLGDGMLETRGRGYVLRVDPEHVDVERFEGQLARGRQLLEAGDERAASETLREALALWRGPPLADFAYEPFAQTEIARLEELRLAALEERIEADLTLGRHAELVAELEALVREHPFREGLRAQLIIALYRCGRQADALDAYRQARETLVDELGLEPSRELQELERSILTHDPRLVGVAPRRRARLRTRRRGGRWIAIGGACLLAAAIGGVVVMLARVDDDGRRVSVVPNSIAVVDPKTNRLVASIGVGDGPTSIAVDAGKVWVLNRDAQTISLVDGKTRALVKTFGVGATPTDLAVSPGRVWVGDSVTSSVLELDPETGTVVRRIAAPPLTPPPRRPSEPVGGAVAVGFGAVWFASGHSTLTRIDPGTGSVVARIRHPGIAARDRPYLSVGERAVWVSTCCEVVVRVDPRGNSVAEAVPGAFRGPIAAGLGGVWLADTSEGLLWRIEPRGTIARNSPARTIEVGRTPLDVAVGEGSIWVASGDGTVSRVDPKSNEVIATIDLGRSLGGIAIGQGAVWVAVD